VANKALPPGEQQAFGQAMARIAALEREVAELRKGNGTVDPSTLTDTPPEARASVASLRSWVLDERNRIQVQKLVSDEIGALVARITSPDLTSQGETFSDGALSSRVLGFRDATLVSSCLYAEAGYWNAPATDKLWARSLGRVADATPGSNGLVVWLHLRLLPALILFYSGGVAALANEKFEGLRSLFFDAHFDENGTSFPAVARLFPANVMTIQAAQRLPGLERHYTPLSDWLFDNLRPSLRSLVPDDQAYDEAFDRFEYFLGVAFLASTRTASSPVGRFAWKNRNRFENGLPQAVASELLEFGDEWPPLKAGVFGRDHEIATQALQDYATLVARTATSWF
jgi:hypothetical protein